MIDRIRPHRLWWRLDSDDDAERWVPDGVPCEIYVEEFGGEWRVFYGAGFECLINRNEAIEAAERELFEHAAALFASLGDAREGRAR